MSSTLVLPIANTISDLAVTRPLPVVDIPTPFQTSPPDWGPRYSPVKGQYYIENFVQPVFQPDPRIVPRGRIGGQMSAQETESCPIVPILYRNEWETYNTSAGKVWGGFTPYSVQDIPSCQERSGSYMNFMDSTKPWNRVLGMQRPEVLAQDAHQAGWAQPIPSWVEKRLLGHKPTAREEELARTSYQDYVFQGWQDGR